MPVLLALLNWIQPAKRKQKDRQTLMCTVQATEVDLSSPPKKVAKNLAMKIIVTQQDSTEEMEQNGENSGTVHQKGDDENEIIIGIQGCNTHECSRDSEKENSLTQPTTFTFTPVSSSSTPPSQQVYHTKLCQQLSSVNGNSKLLEKFDRLRRELKNTKRPRITHQKIYDQLSTEIQGELIKTCSHYRTKVESWEREYLHYHGVHPSPTCVPNDIACVMRQERIISKLLLHEWSMK